MSAKEGMSSTRMVHFSDSAATEEPREVEIIATNDNALNEEDSSASVKLHGEVDANTTSAKSKGVTGYWSKLSGLFLPNKDDDDEEKNEDDDERDDDAEISSRRRKASQINNDFDKLDDLVMLGKDRLINLDMTEDFETKVKVFTVHKVPKSFSFSEIIDDLRGNLRRDKNIKVKEFRYRCELQDKTLKCLYDDVKKNILDIVNRKRKAAIERIKGTKEGVANVIMRTESVAADDEGTVLEDEYFGSYDCRVLMLKDVLDWCKRAEEYNSAYYKGDSKKKHHLEHRITYRKFCILLNLHEVNIIVTNNKLYYIIPASVPVSFSLNPNRAASTKINSAVMLSAAMLSAAAWDKASLRDCIEKPKDYKDSFMYYVLSVLGGKDEDDVEWKTENKFEFVNRTASSFCLRIYTIYFYLFLHNIKYRIDELNHPKEGRYTLVLTKMDGGHKGGEGGGNSCMLSLSFAKELTQVKKELGNIKSEIAKFIKLLNGIRKEDDNLRYLSLDGYNTDFFLGLELDKAKTVATSSRSGVHHDPLNLSDPFKTIDYHGADMLIKHYILDFVAQDNEVDYMINELQFNEKSLELRLETSRNELTLINTYFTITSAFFGFGGFLAGIFGMNLDNSTTTEPGLVQSKKGSFIVVTVISAACIVVGITSTYFYLLYKNIIPEKLYISKRK